MTVGTLSHDECQQALAEGWTDHPAVRAHLATCTACVEFADTLAEVDRLLASIVAPPPPPGLVDRVMRAIREEQQR
jgi:predicted anti-sigma-YlaC factor YlaD